MKKLLSILGIIIFTTTSTTTLISCEKPNNKNIPCEKQDHGNWKQQCSLNDKHFNTVDNKHYIIVWRGTSNSKWKVKLFQNINFPEKSTILDTQDKYELRLTRIGDNLFHVKKGTVRPVISWANDNGTYFKSVYRWDGLDKPETPKIDTNTGKITDWKE